MKKISATIDGGALEEKLIQLEERDFFYDYRELSAHWMKHLHGIPLPAECVLLCGPKPRRFLAVEIDVVDTLPDVGK